jgi:hypothetical protein
MNIEPPHRGFAAMVANVFENRFFVEKQKNLVEFYFNQKLFNNFVTINLC